MTAAAAVAKDLKHEEIFLERYSRLLKWASQLTKPDGELAKDLVQEAFLHFTLAAGDLVTINNIDNYLYGVVRNTYLSHLRRSRQHHEQLPGLEFEAATNLLLTVDPRRQIQIKDELRAICQHACIRKESSVTGSVLILRFFHGYVPSEVAKLLHSSRNIVDVQLRSARYEIIACLANPKTTASADGNPLPLNPPRRRVRLAPDFLAELREEIFATRRGDCFDLNQWGEIYRSRKAVARVTLSHLVSCPRCLDEVNSLLGLPLLGERNAIDVLGRTNDMAGSRPIYSFMIRRLSLIGGWSLWLMLASSASDLLA